MVKIRVRQQLPLAKGPATVHEMGYTECQTLPQEKSVDSRAVSRSTVGPWCPKALSFVAPPVGSTQESIGAFMGLFTNCAYPKSVVFCSNPRATPTPSHVTNLLGPDLLSPWRAVIPPYTTLGRWEKALSPLGGMDLTSS